MHDRLTPVFHRLATLPQVRAIALAGSHATLSAGPASDYDLYVYTEDDIPAEVRRSMGLAFSPDAQIIDAWGPALAWTDPISGVDFDTMFFGTRWIRDQIEKVMQHCEPSLGYSTCFLHTVRVSRILFDPSGWFGRLQHRALQPYPNLLAQRIIALNYPALRDCHSSYRQQLEKAATRGDVISLNHRASAFLASVFDILFALNKVAHPGEKRLLDLAQQLCPLRPPELREDITALLQTAATNPYGVVAAVDRLVDSLKALIDAHPSG